MEKLTLIALVDMIAGENVTDTLLGRFQCARVGVKYPPISTADQLKAIQGATNGQAVFEALLPDKQVSYLEQLAADDGDINLCALQLGIQPDELRGRIEAAILAFRTGLSGGTVYIEGNDD